MGFISSGPKVSAPPPQQQPVTSISETQQNAERNFNTRRKRKNSLDKTISRNTLLGGELDDDVNGRSTLLGG